MATGEPPRTRGGHLLRLLVPKLVLALGALLVAVLAAELTLRWSGVDEQAVAGSLYMQQVHLDLHRSSTDPYLRYELRPSTSKTGRGPYGPFVMRVNARGARGPERDRERGEGVVRILLFGASSVFGEFVGDEQTVAARLEHALADAVRAAHGEAARVEVWNFGTSAYNLAQMSRLARQRVRELPADLVVVMGSNRGRRAFLAGAVEGPPVLEVFAADPTSWAESFPPPARWYGGGLALGVRHLALVRVPWAGRIARGPPLDPGPGDAEGAREARRMHEELEQSGVPVVFTAVPGTQFRAAGDVYPGLEAACFVSLDRSAAPPEWTNTHPPPEILDGWAQALASGLGSWVQTGRSCR